MESQSSAAVVPAGSVPNASDPKPPVKVLIIDDELNLCMLLKDILDEYGFETAYAEDAAGGLEAMRNFRPEVALVDFRLGNITGLEVAQQLKTIDADLPVILMTAYASLDLAVQAIQNDIYDFIAKPVDKTYLLRSIGKAAEKRFLIQENKKLIASLKASNASLDRMNHMKSKFLSIVTHDLRTPLTSIRGYTEMLETEDNLTADDKAKCFGAVLRSVERMNGLIANLMDMVSIEAGKLRVEKAQIDFKAVCMELKETMAPVADTKKIGLEWKLPAGPMMVMGDSSRLVQVLTNLISNAFKHTPEKGNITVQAACRDGKVLTEVIDTGRGIALEDQAKIFEQFYQVESSPTRRDGLGLGLSITREIITSHQGEIGVSSEGMGKGSRFWFTLPLLS